MMFIKIVVLKSYRGTEQDPYHPNTFTLSIRSLPGTSYKVNSVLFNWFTCVIPFSPAGLYHFLRDAHLRIVADARVQLKRLQRSNLLKALADHEISFHEFQREMRNNQ